MSRRRILLANQTQGGGGFSPLDLIPNLWLDATDSTTITEVSGDVSQWDDKSGNGNDVSQGTAANRPSNGGTINGNNALDWGTAENNKSLILSRGSNTDNWQDVYIIGRYGLTGNTFPGGPFGIFNSTAAGGTSAGLGLNTKPNDSTLGHLLWWYNTLYLNNILTPSATSVIGVSNTISNNFLISFSRSSSIGVNGVAIGNVWNLPDPFGWRGVIGEVVAFPRKLSDTERGQMNAYLTNKWGL